MGTISSSGFVCSPLALCCREEHCFVPKGNQIYQELLVVLFVLIQLICGLYFETCKRLFLCDPIVFTRTLILHVPCLTASTIWSATVETSTKSYHQYANALLNVLGFRAPSHLGLLGQFSLTGKLREVSSVNPKEFENAA